MAMIDPKDAQAIAPLLETRRIESVEEIKSRIDGEDAAMQYLYDLIFKEEARAVDVLIHLFDHCRREDVLDRVISGPLELALERFAPEAQERFSAHAQRNAVLKALLSGSE